MKIKSFVLSLQSLNSLRVWKSSLPLDCLTTGFADVLRQEQAILIQLHPEAFINSVISAITF